MLLLDVILPLPLDGLFTYKVGEDCRNVVEGCRVIVQFGKKKYYTAIVSRVYEGEAKDNLKEIISLLDDYPIVLPSQLELWRWIAVYYMCALGDVYKAALPSALKLESETFVFKNGLFEAESPLTPTEQKLFFALSETQPIRISELEKNLNLSNVVPHVKSLVDKGAVFLNESINNNYSAKTEAVISLYRDFSEEELLSTIDSLSRAKKQQKLLLSFLEMKENSVMADRFVVQKKDLLIQTGVSLSVLDGLIDRNILKQSDREISRFNYGEVNLDASKVLNSDQEQAYNEIKLQFVDKPVVLLHGVTASGKTEIYVQLIKDALAEGKQILYLLPEIALTTQITERLKGVFGNKLLVYHSRFNDNERAETWTSLLTKGESFVVLGARSSVFLPFNNLGLIIVDEEHESSYKQQDPAPRYNARNAAIVLGSIHKTSVLLGTATPAIESYNNALTGKYGLVKLTKRHENIAMPQVEAINIKDLRRRKQMKFSLSPPLIAEMKSVLAKGEQVILFQNRRGFAPLLECKTCAWTPHCNHCDVSLTYHKGLHTMLCHYCGAVYKVLEICPNCETPTLDVVGYGTERIEEEVSELFPEAVTARMDLDTTRSKRAYERIISDFENKKTDILIGTQMVSKGLDFENVSVVGVINADSSLNFPDFRAHEKAFQLMTQVSGRAGRKNKQGRVLLQTAHPSHPIISYVINNDYNSFYNSQIEERRLFRYPPFYRLISIVLKSRDAQVVDRASVQFASAMKDSFGDRVLGPTKPPVSRVQSLYIRQIMLKVEMQASPQNVRDVIKHIQDYLFKKPEFRSVLIYFDVDPQF